MFPSIWYPNGVIHAQVLGRRSGGVSCLVHWQCRPLRGIALRSVPANFCHTDCSAFPESQQFPLGTAHQASIIYLHHHNRAVQAFHELSHCVVSLPDRGTTAARAVASSDWTCVLGDSPNCCKTYSNCDRPGCEEMASSKAHQSFQQHLNLQQYNFSRFQSSCQGSGFRLGFQCSVRSRTRTDTTGQAMFC